MLSGMMIYFRKKRSDTHLKNTMKNACSKKTKISQLSRQNMSRQIPSQQFSFERKTGPGQLPTQYLCSPRRIRYLQTKGAGDGYKFDFIMDQETELFC